MNTLYLASSSPRRRELLTQIGVPFTVVVAPIDETPQTDESAQPYVQRMAVEKARAGWQALGNPDDAMVLGADTAVLLDGRILGKPVDEAHALSMLAALSGRSHEVRTSVALCSRHGCETVSEVARVTFTSITPEQARLYWASGEPRDKAGGYAIQGLGAVFVEKVEGSYSAVVGLGLFETARLLAANGIPCWQTFPCLQTSI